MRKRLFPLLILMLVALAVTPAAMAQCERCKITPPDQCPYCFTPTTGPKYLDCFSDAFACTCNVDTSTLCASANVPVRPLGADFKVASVERLDEPAAPAATLVASTALARSTQR